MSVSGVVGMDGVVDSLICSETPLLVVVSVVTVVGVGVGSVTVGSVLGGLAAKELVGELVGAVVVLTMKVGDVLADVCVDALVCSEAAVDWAVEGVVGGGKLLSVDELGLSVVWLLSAVVGRALVDDSVDAATVVFVVSTGTVASSVVAAVSVVV